MPAAAVIPALIVYTKIAAVKKLVVDIWSLQRNKGAEPVTGLCSVCGVYWVWFSIGGLLGRGDTRIFPGSSCSRVGRTVQEYTLRLYTGAAGFPSAGPEATLGWRWESHIRE